MKFYVIFLVGGARIKSKYEKDQDNRLKRDYNENTFDYIISGSMSVPYLYRCVILHKLLNLSGLFLSLFDENNTNPKDWEIQIR